MRGQWLQPPQLDGTVKGFVSEMTFHLELNYSRGYIFKMWRTSHIITGPQRRKSYHVVFGSHKEISLARDTGAEGNGLMSVRQTGPVLHPLKQGSSKSQALWGTHWKLHYMLMAGGGRGWEETQPWSNPALGMGPHSHQGQREQSQTLHFLLIKS